MPGMKYAAVPMLLLMFCLGCGKKPEPTLQIFCCETYWNVMREVGGRFASVYGVHVQLIPVFVPDSEPPLPQEPERETRRRSPTPWRMRPTERRALAPSRMEPDGRIGELIATISDRTRYGDIYLTDSPKQAEMLHEGAAVAREYPFCVLTLTLLVAKDNPYRIDSVRSLLDADCRLGIGDPSLDGMGETALRLLSRYLRVGDGGRHDERITLFDRHDKLLTALENREVDAVLVWEPLVLGTAGFADVIELPAEERQVVRQPLLALSMASNQAYGKRFADFLLSPRGREILKKNGFAVSE